MMNHAIKGQFANRFYQSTLILLCLSGMLLLESCHEGIGQFNPNFGKENVDKQGKQEVKSLSSPDEIILFCGNPGVGKSSLCNSIFQQHIFKSGVTVGQGLTREKQEYTHENKKYIDTPGLADVRLREQAAKEIEKALKENNNYKIIFVGTLEAGKIREADLVTINTVCAAIKTPFEYGIIFNKVTKRVIEKIGENGENLASYLEPLHKKPVSTIVIKKDEDMEDAENTYLSSGSENMTKLISFIDNLRANMILDRQVQTIDVRAYEEKVREMETKLQEALKKAEEQKIETQEALRKAEEQRIETEKAIQKLAEERGQFEARVKRLQEESEIKTQQVQAQYKNRVDQLESQVAQAAQATQTQTTAFLGKITELQTQANQAAETARTQFYAQITALRGEMDEQKRIAAQQSAAQAAELQRLKDEALKKVEEEKRRLEEDKRRLEEEKKRSDEKIAELERARTSNLPSVQQPTQFPYNSLNNFAAPYIVSPLSNKTYHGDLINHEFSAANPHAVCNNHQFVPFGSIAGRRYKCLGH